MTKNKSTILTCIMFSLVILFSAFIASAAQSTVNLGTAGDFVILTKTGISSTGVTSVVGNIGVSPIDSTAITGFGLILDPTTQFSTSSLLNGKAYAADYTTPTDTILTTAVGDMETAYTNAAGRTLPDYTETGAGDIGGMTLTAGLYKWGTGVIIPTDVILSGSATDIWIFQIAGTLDLASDKQIKLIGGATADNIFWVVSDQTTLGTNSVFNGNILDMKAIVITTGATLNGRALSQTAVTLDANAVALPINVNDIILPTATVTYNITALTNGNILVTLHPSELIHENLTYVFKQNVNAYVINFTDLANNKGSVVVNISNIDKVVPNIYLIGGDVTLTVGEEYNDSGATANDTNSGNLTSRINVTNNVNTSIVGTYIVQYNVTDNADNHAFANRTVIINAVQTTPGNSGGSGGGSGYCSTQWNCTEWSVCNLGSQTRTCSYRTNYCTPRVSKPLELRTCIVASTDSNTTPIDKNKGVLGITGAVIGGGMTGWTWLWILIGLIILALIFLLVRYLVKRNEN